MACGAEALAAMVVGTDLRLSAFRLVEIAHILGIPVLALYPEESFEPLPPEVRRISEFVASDEGLRLCQAFLAIRNTHLRRKIVALLEEISENKRVTGNKVV